jgi:hypothetical protein
MAQSGCESNAKQLRDVIKVPVASVEWQVMLNDQGGDPNIIGRNGRALRAQLSE